MGTPTDTVTYSYGDSNWGDKLTSYDGKTITYDGVGNPLSDGTWTYTWRHGRELSTMTNGTITVRNSYNPDGARIAKIVNRSNGSETHRYTYNGGKLVYDIIRINKEGTISNLTILMSYDESGRPFMITYANVSYYYLLNAQGDVVGIMNVSGDIMVEYTYDAWGNVLSITGPMASTMGQHNQLRYRGYVYDPETGLYFLNSRFYDPEIGRFINADALTSTGGLLGNNMFAYCYSNPVKFIDSWGLLPLLLFEAQPVAFGEEGTPPDSTHPKDVPPDHPDFTPPKKGNKKKKNPDGKGWGWVDKDGNIWEWFPDMHGGAGWIIHKPKGGHGHAYPGGGRRNHFDMIPVQLSDVRDFQRYPQTSSLTNIQGHFTHEMAAQPALFGGAVCALIYLVIFDSEYFNLNEG